MICPVLYVFMEVMHMKRTQFFFHFFIGTSRDMGYPFERLRILFGIRRVLTPQRDHAAASG